MPISRPTYQEILSNITNNILATLGMDATVESSITGVISRIVAAGFDQLWETLEQADKQSKLTTATGAFLDDIGGLFGVNRLTSRPATTIGLTRSVLFTNNGDTALQVPTGTRVWTADDASRAFFTTESAVVPPGGTAFVHVESANSGAYYNVGIGLLTQCNLAGTTMTVTNVLPITSGTDLESDDSYRSRIQQEITRRNTLNPDNLRALVRSVPGVRDAWVLNFERGSGTVDVITFPYVYGDAPSVVDSVQAILDENVPVGVSAQAMSPIWRYVDLSVRLSIQPSYISTRESIRAAVRATVSALVDNLPVEDGSGAGSLATNTILSRTMNASIGIADAQISIALDGNETPLGSTLTIGVGERIVIRGLSVV